MAAPMTRGKQTMSSESNPSSSESSADEETDSSEKMRRLKEAAVTADYISDLYQATAQKKTGGSTESSIPSKRYVDVNDHEDENPLKTTPEFRAFVSRKLTEKLDREIEYCETEGPVTSEYATWILQDTRIDQEGVRLFSDSTQVLRSVKEDVSQPPARKKPRLVPLSRDAAADGSSKAERLASVAVTADFLVAEREMWARLRQSSQDEKQENASATPDKDTSSTKEQETVNKKKKKKKKVKGEREGTGKMGSDCSLERSSRQEKMSCDPKSNGKVSDDNSSSFKCVSENLSADNLRVMEDGKFEEQDAVKKKKKKKKKHKTTEN